MKKILLLFLTILLGALLVGCTGRTSKPLATDEEIKNYTVLSSKEKHNFLENAAKETYNTIKLTLTVKSETSDLVKQKTDIVAEMHISKDLKTMYVNYKKISIEAGDKTTGLDINLNGNMYFENNKLYLQIKGKFIIYDGGNNITTEINQKIKFGDDKPLFVETVDILKIDEIFAKITKIKKSPDGNLYVAVIDGTTKIFFNKDFKIVQVVTGNNQIMVIIDIIKTNVEVPKLTEKQKKEYKDGEFKLPELG